MNILFTICGRAGSKGIKNKNLRSLLNKPLAYWTISAIDLFVKKQNSFKDLSYDIALNTDSLELVSMVQNSKMKQIDIVNRKDELAGDVIGKIDVVRDTFLQMSQKKNVNYDIVIDLDITSPLRTENDIKNLINKYKETLPDVVFSVTESRRNPYFNMVQRNSEGKIEKVINSQFTSRQQAPTVYDMNASLYAYNPEFLIKNMQLFDAKSEIIEMLDTAVLDLDKPIDFDLLEVLARYFVENYNGFSEVYNNNV